ncbi:hypothetical protein H7X46_19135 [Pseudonocardia sp. C8]|uniref:hypothetical protein n=1 Tax=Pseudonocardia sp. C8 TaxID=2762759 RepID=UPI001642A535|nr:hypothetical protein [Pseudonocardia sp. C8]MBC3193178.1 hypothetical protein [Pseudonocardia sp. C8]
MARTRQVNAADGRRWVVRQRIEWTTPAIGDDFEHDVDGGRGAVVPVLSAVVLFWTLLIVWAPDGVHVPWWLWLFAVVGIGFFPLRWLNHRPYTIVAETAGSHEYPAELWTGMVRGRSAAREEVRIVIRSLQGRATPGHADSPIQPVR